GAVRANDDFDFFACLNHNYREFLFGFDDWVTSIAAAGDADAYRSKFSYDETRSMWQSLGFGPNYKAAYCMAVCPAGDDVIGAYMADKQAWRREVVEPFKDKVEPVYVASGSRAERVARRNPNKRLRYIDYRVDVSTPDNFELGLRHRFEARRAGGVTCSVAFEFPSGSIRVAVVNDDGLSIGDPTDETPDCVVRLAGADYIAVIHPNPEPTDVDVPRYELVGDPAAFGALLACLD
ncbi:MAG: 4Fe-4S ferredoxin, partial [Actinomycetota bacterium]